MINARLLAWLVPALALLTALAAALGHPLAYLVLLPVPVLVAVYRTRVARRWPSSFAAYSAFTPDTAGTPPPGDGPWHPASVRLYLPMAGPPILVLTDPDDGAVRHLWQVAHTVRPPFPEDLPAGAWYREHPGGGGVVAAAGTASRRWPAHPFTQPDYRAPDRTTRDLTPFLSDS